MFLPRLRSGARPDPGLGLVRPCWRMSQRLDILLRMGADMKIEAGKYYRTRGGDVVGPMTQSTDKRYPWTVFSQIVNSLRWTPGGDYSYATQHPQDLISEVYVSDTTPAPQVNTTKTARDELVEKAALAILNGSMSKQNTTLWHSEIWLMAEQFVEARKK